MKVYLIGIGMGDNKTLTAEAARAMEDAEIFIGAERMFEAVKAYDKPKYKAYKPDEIEEYLLKSTAGTAAVLLSGDISFYSGAKGLTEKLKAYEIVHIPGISSYSYMCAKLGIAVTDTELVSLHGPQTDYFNKKSICNIVRDSKYTFALLNEPKDINSLITQLGSYKLNDCIIHIGSRLGYEDEMLCETGVSYMFDAEREEIKAPVSVIIENPSPKNLLGRHIKDDEFIRDKVPMTKEDIRALCISRLALDRDSVLYDIGAGTGSIAVEASLTSHDIKVYAVEKKSEGYVLINQNRCKFGCDNVFLINGEAPEALECLPAPTHVFIGGSDRRLKEIVECVIRKNPAVKIVINTIALNSAAEVMRVIEELDLDSEIISVNIAKSKKVRGYDMMMGQNPVYIFTLTKKPDAEGAEDEK
ncbi:MAG: precorrin-6y C5,15-methyltransferase (decarboxylating) subunit CbiE [Candidatus Ornithomonoglobus sp.]